MGRQSMKIYHQTAQYQNWAFSVKIQSNWRKKTGVAMAKKWGEEP